MTKPMICTIAAIPFFVLAVIFLFFPRSDFAVHVLRHITYGAQLARAQHLGLGFIGTGLAILAWGWRDAWQG